MINNSRMKIKVQLVSNVNDQIVGKKNLFIVNFEIIFYFFVISRRPENTHASQSGAELEERMKIFFFENYHLDLLQFF